MNLFIDVHELIPDPLNSDFLYGCYAVDDNGRKVYFSETISYVDASPSALNDLIKSNVSSKFAELHDCVIDNTVMYGNFFT